MAPRSLKLVIAEVLQIHPNLLDENSGMNVTENWDSLNQFMITTAIEREFGMRLLFTEMQEVSTLASIRSFLERRNVVFSD